MSDLFWGNEMNGVNITETLLLGLGILAGLLFLGGCLFVVILRKMTGPLGLSVQQVEDMLSQPPSLELDFIPAPPAPVKPELVAGLSNIGYHNWASYFINQSKVLTAHIGEHPNGTVAIVYQHALMGTWFEVYAETHNKTYIWSSTPLFDQNAIRANVVMRHHRLLTIHTTLEEMRELNIVPISFASRLEYLKQQHIKNEIHRLSIPLQTVNIAPLLAQTGKTDPEIIDSIKNNAQAARLLHLENLAWDVVGGDNVSGETFVIHPYSIVSEDIHVLMQQLKNEKVWPHSWDDTAIRVPPDFMQNVSSAIEKSLQYSVVKTVAEPLPVIVVKRT